MNAEISRLDYFVAHAPVDPWPHFQPDVPGEPQRNPDWHWCDGCIADSDCNGGANCGELRQWRKDKQSWSEYRDCERLRQWPLFWANEMVKFLEFTR